MIDSPPAHGMLGAARGILATLLEMAQTRLQLLALDLRMEGQRLLLLLGTALAALCMLMMVLMGASMLLVLVLWQQYGALAALGVLMALLALAVLCALLSAHLLRRGPRPFAASIAELEKDLADLREGS